MKAKAKKFHINHYTNQIDTNNNRSYLRSKIDNHNMNNNSFSHLNHST